MSYEDEIDFDDDLPENALWCDRCQGLGMAECYCGGDQCYCENNGEMDCPQCNGEGFYVPAARQLAYEAEMRRVLSEALARDSGRLPKGEDAPAAECGASQSGVSDSERIAQPPSSGNPK